MIGILLFEENSNPFLQLVMLKLSNKFFMGFVHSLLNCFILINFSSTYFNKYKVLIFCILPNRVEKGNVLVLFRGNWVLRFIIFLIKLILYVKTDKRNM